MIEYSEYKKRYKCPDCGKYYDDTYILTVHCCENCGWRMGMFENYITEVGRWRAEYQDVEKNFFGIKYKKKKKFYFWEPKGYVSTFVPTVANTTVQKKLTKRT